jgi:hypothetical protein
MITKEDLPKWYLLNEDNLKALNNSSTFISLPSEPVCVTAGGLQNDMFYIDLVANPNKVKLKVWATGKVAGVEAECVTLPDALNWIHEQWEIFYENLPQRVKADVIAKFVPPGELTKLPPATTLDFNDLPI